MSPRPALVLDIGRNVKKVKVMVIALRKSMSILTKNMTMTCPSTFLFPLHMVRNHYGKAPLTEQWDNAVIKCDGMSFLPSENL
jgi:hypothetical protein